MEGVLHDRRVRRRRRRAQRRDEQRQQLGCPRHLLTSSERRDTKMHKKRQERIGLASIFIQARLYLGD